MEPGPAAGGAVAAADQQLVEVGADWVQITNGSQAPYYWHRPTGRTQWVRPLEACDEVAGSEEPDTDQQYFAAYGNWWKIQREMLADRPRMQSYVDAIEANADAIRGRVVIDVGAGTGVLSLFCALKGGAAHVIAIEGSSMALVAREMAAAHGLSDRITVINARVEDLPAQLPGLPAGCEQADAIVSEWMGTGLLGEGMFDSVLRARDLWLRPGGRLLPSTARMFITGWQHPATAELLRLGLGPGAALLSERLLEEWRGRPMLTALPPSAVVSDSVCIADLDLTTIATLGTTIGKLTKKGTFDDGGSGGLTEIVSQRTVELTVGGGGSHELAPPQPGAMGAAAAGHGAVVWAGACIWWETGFSSDRDHESAGSVVLTTEPGRAATHWGQLLLVDDHAPRLLRKGDKVQLEGLRMVRDPAFKRNYIVVRQRSCFS